MILIGPQITPITGQSEAFKVITDELEIRKIKFTIIRFSATKKFLLFTEIIKSFDYIIIYIKFLLKIISTKNKFVYINLSATKGGILRDAGFIYIAKLFRLKVIAHCHFGNVKEFYDGQNIIFKSIIKKTIEKIDYIIVLSARLKKMLDYFPKVKNRIKVIPNCIPFNIQNRNISYKSLPTTSKFPIKLIYLSNLIESKGYLDVLEAVRVLIYDYKINVELNIYGKFLSSNDDISFKNVVEAENFYHSFLEKNKLKDNVTYHGEVRADKKVQVLTDAHFLLLPTSYVLEGQPISIIEALATGTPIIATNYRAIGDLVIEGKTGFFVDYNKPSQIAVTIAEISRQQELYLEMSKNCFLHYNKNFTKEKYLLSMLDVFSKFS